MTSKSSKTSKKARMPRRTTVWSSTRNTRIGSSLSRSPTSPAFPWAQDPRQDRPYRGRGGQRAVDGELTADPLDPLAHGLQPEVARSGQVRVEADAVIGDLDDERAVRTRRG